MTPQETATKQRRAALRVYMIAFHVTVGNEADYDDDELIQRFHQTLYMDMEQVSAEMVWEEPPMPGEVGN